MSKFDFLKRPTRAGLVDRLSRFGRMGQNFCAGGKGEKNIFLFFKKQYLILPLNSLATFFAKEAKSFFGIACAMFMLLEPDKFQKLRRSSDARSYAGLQFCVTGNYQDLKSGFKSAVLFYRGS